MRRLAVALVVAGAVGCQDRSAAPAPETGTTAAKPVRSEPVRRSPGLGPSAGNGDDPPPGEAVQPAPKAASRDEPETPHEKTDEASGAAWGQALPGVRRRLPPSGRPRLALTLDACGGPGGDGYDQELIELLVAERIAATLFLTARWIGTHREVALRLAQEPLFDLENHGASHKPCSVDGRHAFGIPGTASVDAAREEVVRGRRSIEMLGRVSRFFRPGTGYYVAECIRIVRAAGAAPIGFSVSGDAGGAFSRAQVRRALVEATDGSIVLLHMNQPHGATAEGLRDALPELRSRGLTFVRLSDVWRRERRAARRKPDRDEVHR